MHKHELAKLLLSRFTTDERAAAIVGDLIEVSPSDFRFWHAVALTAAALSTKPAFGVLAAIATESLVRYGYSLSWKASNPTNGITGFFAAWMMFLTLIAAYSAVRRGLTDVVTKTAGALWLFASAGVFLRLIEWIPQICGVSAALIVMALLSTGQGRRTLLAILVAAAAALGASYASWWLLFSFGPAGQHSAYSYIAVLYVMPTVSVAAALSWSQLAPVRQPDSVVQ